MTKDDIVENTIRTDGGLSLSGMKDNNNCTIRALSIASGIPYDEAFEIGRSAGRKTGHGFYTHKLMAHARKNGIAFRKMNYKSITLQKFLSMGLVGRFIVKRRGHAFAIIGGVIHDTIVNPPLSRLTEIYKVESHRLERIKAIQF
jgi:hypothetical protein